MPTGYALISELAGSKLFGAYVRAFPAVARDDAGAVLRVAVQLGLVDRYQDLLKQALEERRPVAEADWHALCALVSWPRGLPAWDRAPIEQWRLDMNPDATPDWPEAYIGGCHFGRNSWIERRLGFAASLFALLRKLAR
jgi:hypothetical protein